MYLQITAAGNVGKDPELTYSQTGLATCRFSVATSRKWNNKQTNEKNEETTWLDVTVFGQLAETCNQYVEKGMKVLIVANQLKASPYASSEGPRASLKVVAQDVRFLSGGGNGASQHDDGRGGSASTWDGDEIPF